MGNVSKMENLTAQIEIIFKDLTIWRLGLNYHQKFKLINLQIIFNKNHQI
jgi:hypothetical protein